MKFVFLYRISKRYLFLYSPFNIILLLFIIIVFLFVVIVVIEITEGCRLY